MGSLGARRVAGVERRRVAVERLDPRALVTPAVSVDASTGYALGWLVATRPWAGPGGRVLTHAGSNTMNYAVAWLAPEGKFGILVVTNQGGPAATRATDAVVGRLIALHR